MRDKCDRAEKRAKSFRVFFVFVYLKADGIKIGFLHGDKSAAH